MQSDQGIRNEMDGTRGKLLLLGASVLVAMVLAEVVLRIFNPFPEASHDPGARPPELPAGESNTVERDDQLGWKLRPDLNVRVSLRDSYDVTVVSNSKGIRDRREFPYAKPSGTLRILALGDSFTFGTGVENDETWPARLEFHLRQAGADVEVINAGVGAYGTDQTYLYYLAEGTKYDADLVVIGHCPCHMRRNATDFFVAPKPRFVRRGETLTMVPPDMTAGPPQMNRVGARFYLYRYLSQAVDVLGIVPSYFSLGEGYRITALIFENLTRDIQNNGSDVLVAYIPRQQEITSRWAFMLRQHAEALGALMDRLGVDFVDVTPAVRIREGESLYLQNEMGHMNRAGNDLIGLTLARQILSAGSLSSSAAR